MYTSTNSVSLSSSFHGITEMSVQLLYCLHLALGLPTSSSSRMQLLVLIVTRTSAILLVYFIFFICLYPLQFSVIEQMFISALVPHFMFSPTVCNLSFSVRISCHWLVFHVYLCLTVIHKTYVRTGVAITLQNPSFVSM